MKAVMKTLLNRLFLILALLLVTASLYAQTLAEASREAARKYNAEVISAKTVQQGNKKVHVIKLLTKNGVVKTVRVPVKDDRKGR